MNLTELEARLDELEALLDDPQTPPDVRHTLELRWHVLMNELQVALVKEAK